MNLEYGEIYDLRIAGEDYKGIYLGHRNPRVRLKSKHVFLVNKPSNKLSLHSYSIVNFSNYRFECGKLILQRMFYINPLSRERNYLEELCKKFG